MRLVLLTGIAVIALNVLSFSQEAPAPPAPAAALFSVDSIAIAAGIESRAPAGISTEFAADIGKVSCWAKISSSQAPVSVKFVWYKNEQIVLEWQYSLIMESGRLWSTKSVTTGKWKVEIVDGAKNVVKTASFEIK